jgi:hypothetical protein
MTVTVQDPQHVYEPATFQVPYVDPSPILISTALKLLGIEKMFGCLVSQVDPKVTRDYLNTVQLFIDP